MEIDCSHRIDYLFKLESYDCSILGYRVKLIVQASSFKIQILVALFVAIQYFKNERIYLSVFGYLLGVFKTLYTKQLKLRIIQRAKWNWL